MSDRLDDARSIALQTMIDGMERILAEDSPARRLPIGWRGGDHTCDVIGDQIMGDDAEIDGEREDLDLYIATQVYAGGGHTAVVGDFVRASDSRRAEVIVTGTVERDIHGGEIPDAIVERLGISADALSVCPHEDRAVATRWLMGEIRARRPRRVFLFHHPQDAVAIAAARVSLCGELFLVHHADRQPTLGLHQRGTQIVDLSPFTSEFTRRVLGLKTAYAPLIIADPGGIPQDDTEEQLTTASSGSAHKFGEDYPEIITRVLNVTGGRHIHFGFLKKGRLAKISAHLEQRGIDPGRFEYVEWVPSLARGLQSFGVDLCIGSAPMGGARTAIESAAASVPMLSHLPEFSTRFGVSHVKPQSWPVWRTVEELVELVKAADGDRGWIEEQGIIGRDYYEKNHHPDQLEKALGDLETSCLPPRDDLPLSELIDVDRVGAALVGEWKFLRSELGPLA